MMLLLLLCVVVLLYSVCLPGKTKQQFFYVEPPHGYGTVYQVLYDHLALSLHTLTHVVNLEYVKSYETLLGRFLRQFFFDTTQVWGQSTLPSVYL
jgi:hypothetical protein